MYDDTDTTNMKLLQPLITSADADDDFGFTTDIEFFEDSKKIL